MIEQTFSESARQRLRSLVIAAIPPDHGDDELTDILAMLSGVDTVLIARRAYKARIVTARDPKRIALRRRQDKEAGIE